MAGATHCGLGCTGVQLRGEACLRINIRILTNPPDCALAERLAGQLAGIRSRLLALTDEDGADNHHLRRLARCRHNAGGSGSLMPDARRDGPDVHRAASLLQEFRPLIDLARDDLEMAIALLAGTQRAAALLLDSNLRLWPEPDLQAKFEPELAALREEAGRVRPVGRIRP